MILVGLFYQKSYSQNFVNLPQTPLLINPSFSGTDSNAVVIAYQNSKKKSFFEEKYSKDFFVSYDRLSKRKNLATGAYCLYSQSDNNYDRTDQLTGPVSHLGISKQDYNSETFNTGVFISPKYPLHYLHIVNSRIVFEPSFMLTYTHTLSNDFYHAQTFDVDNILNKTLQNTYATDSSVFKSNKIGAFAGFMLRSQYFFLSYKLGFSTDFNSEYRKNIVSDSSLLKSSEISYSKPYTLLSHTFAIGASISNDSSIFNFSPVVVISFWEGLNFKRSHGYAQPSLKSQYDFRIYEFAPVHVSLNFRLYRVLFGVAQTNNMANAYLGYKIKYGKILLGIGNNNASLILSTNF